MGTKGTGKLGGISQDTAVAQTTRQTYAWFGTGGMSPAVPETSMLDVSYCPIGCWLCARQCSRTVIYALRCLPFQQSVIRRRDRSGRVNARLWLLVDRGGIEGQPGQSQIGGIRKRRETVTGALLGQRRHHLRR